jgi:hypothetical protein
MELSGSNILFQLPNSSSLLANPGNYRITVFFVACCPEYHLIGSPLGIKFIDFSKALDISLMPPNTRCVYSQHDEFSNFLQGSTFLYEVWIFFHALYLSYRRNDNEKIILSPYYVFWRYIVQITPSYHKRRFSQIVSAICSHPIYVHCWLLSIFVLLIRLTPLGWPTCCTRCYF